MGVGQGEGGPMIDIMGWRMDDAVALIRGTEDTVVRLDVLPAEAGADGNHKLVSLVRKKISLEKQAAKKSVIEVKDGERNAPHRRDLPARVLSRILPPARRATRISRARPAMSRACWTN